MQPTFLGVVLHFGGPIIALIFLVWIGFSLWMQYINELYLDTIEWIVLEVVPPKEVFKSPAAMELVLNSLYGGDASNWFLKYWKGELSQFYSLEIASIEGSIHFFVRFHKKFRKVFEAQLYAQYPQAVVREVEDYTKSVPDYTPDGPINLMGYNLELAKADALPIKSYVDYGLDRAVGSLDEVERIDPMTPTLEIMGSIGIGEQIWMQIIMMKDTKRHTVKNAKGEEEEGKSWKDAARAAIREQREKLKIKDDEGNVITVDRPTRGDQNIIEAIERHMNKYGFDSTIRVVYVADKAHFNGPTIGAFTAMFRQYATEDMNSFKLSGFTKPPDEPWKDLGGKKLHKKKAKMLKAYKGRGFFFGGFDFKKLKTYFHRPEKLGGKPFILSTEELATIWHLPGKVAETPTFLRTEATKSEPPSNLPI